ncbi:MAG: chromosome segregation protein SMC [Planctomycetota bacterium]
MLKALEISGFKSFADKTRFEFPDGITVIVGPNGSGKSNIVDAIKWVLGEQSAKSLRGKDMSDVIFKGSTGAGARKPANSATATIILDNADRRFPYDADEVHVGRRVYRSGETEYLINNETSRLKDVRNLFRGTGVGADAYSLIEQGKVDRLLQAGAKERRAIFEEAAGISRFKAKKVESERRLARVQANLVRLADIVNEVGNRYRSVKAQASKAVRYKEYTERLQQLRTYVGMKDWRSFSEKLDGCSAEAGELHGQAEEIRSEIESRQQQATEAEQKLDKLTTELQSRQEAGAEQRELIAQIESRIQLNESRQVDLAERREQLSAQLERSEVRTSEFESTIAKSESDLESAEIKFRDSSDELKKLESGLEELDNRVTTLREQAKTNGLRHAELLTLVTEIGRIVSAGESQVTSLSETKSRYESSVTALSGELDGCRKELASVESEQKELQQQAESKDTALAEARQKFDQYRASLEAHQSRLAKLSSDQAGATQRASVIEELEKKLEGVNAGARELLQLSKQKRSGPMSEVVGLVADLVSVNVQHAAIVDVALGEVAQYIVVDGEQLVGLMADEKLKVKGRVGIIQLQDPPSLGTDPSVDVTGAKGVIGRADKLVQAKPEFTGFVGKLLSGTWVVKSLADALRLSESKKGQVRFVTLDGEVVEADGTVIVGPKSAASGLVSRRSELRSLHRQMEEFKTEIAGEEEKVVSLRQLSADSETQVNRLLGENTEMASRLSECKTRSSSLSEQLAGLEEQLETAASDREAATGRLADLQHQLEANREKLVSNETLVTTLAGRIAGDQGAADEALAERLAVEKAATKSKVTFAKSEQALSELEMRLGQLRDDFAEHQKTTSQIKTQLATDKKTEAAASDQIREGKEELAKLQVDKEELSDELTKLTSERSEVDAARRKIAVELNGKRDALRNVEDAMHQSKLRVEQLTMQREQLATRLKDDYNIDIAEVDVELSEEEQNKREEIDAEITQLRKKVGAIGAVNVDALNELEEIESRYLEQEEQYNDLVKAKETLERIISRINTDSRRQFVDTLDAVRTNFQKLFRQTFGGGNADIVLEEGVDPLEAGVEIRATPPGKPEFSNSLLSGGEKALTAVSLLMAIFQYQPSPYCVLDEVDAPFDEANIGRFIEVLKSFLGMTKFVIVTHSKKTMTAATTLYGITMQESGVSKRVSVRFEDVSEDGHISQEAIDRDAAEDAA